MPSCVDAASVPSTTARWPAGVSLLSDPPYPSPLRTARISAIEMPGRFRFVPARPTALPNQPRFGVLMIVRLGGRLQSRVEPTLHRHVKALEEPSGIVQDAATVCDNPTRSRVQWSDRSPRDRREANLYISARTEPYTAMTFTPAPSNRWLRHRVPGGPERYRGLAAWKAHRSREENRLTAKTTAKYGSSQPNFVPTDVGLWHGSDGEKGQSRSA